MKFILGKKIGMTQVWRGDEVVAVTRVQAGPCVVTQVKNADKDGYQAVQIGFEQRKAKNVNKAQKGQMAKTGVASFQDKMFPRYLREFRVGETGEVKAGDRINVGTFVAGDAIQVTGISKGKGFQGVVKRYKFSGQPKTHGTKDQVRMPGSSGSTGPAHVFKGRRMPGRMGGEQVTTKNLEVVEVDLENNTLLIKGSVPGSSNGLVLIAGKGDLQIIKEEVKAEVKAEEPKVETVAEVMVEEPVKEVKPETVEVKKEEAAKQPEVKETK